MTIYFYNEEPIDLNAIAVMGVSVKVNDNPIGFFGTGSRFSIATWLRHGCKVTLVRNGEIIPFTTKTEVIRGQEFNRVYMGDDPLGFTSDLGKTWEPWQALRELACNAFDEGGEVSDKLPAGDWGTVFIVEGGPADEAYANRHETFLMTPTAWESAGCDIHRGTSRFGYYRGVRAYQGNSLSLHTYNVKERMNLTEDRTIKDTYWYKAAIATALIKCDIEEIVHDAVMADQGWLERDLDYDRTVTPSDAFMAVVGRMRGNAHLNPSALKIWKRHANVNEVYTEVTLDAYEERLLDDALRLVDRIGGDIRRGDFIVVNGLGSGIYGAVRSGQILIAKAAFDMGARFLASTLYEEWLHHTQDMEDESRELQNLLFEKLFGFVERIVAIEDQGQVRLSA